jgi:dihydroorotase-like cyclic amidohydrolase
MSPSIDLVVRGGRVVTPTEVLDTALAMSDGKIVALGAERMLPPAERTIDATGKYVLPGLIDCHVHLGAVYDDWRTGPVAAAHAGLTTLLSFVE